jgi:hypothetical protein
MRDLIPNDHDHVEPVANEVQFALVIARMIDTVKNSPEHMRQAVYDLARYKLQEQFTHADAKDIKIFSVRSRLSKRLFAASIPISNLAAAGQS